MLATLALTLSLALAPKPHIVWKPIPFGPQRKAEMAAYAQRHYGIRSWRLHPKVIVEHFTGSDSFSSAWNTFAANTPDPELAELPGTCAHFIVDRDGTIYQLVRLTVMCRHTVGLNYVALGIENVGTSDGDRVELDLGTPGGAATFLPGDEVRASGRAGMLDGRRVFVVYRIEERALADQGLWHGRK